MELGSLKTVAPLVLKNKIMALKHIGIKYFKSNNSTAYATLDKNDLKNGSLPSNDLNSILIGLILSDAGYIDHHLLLILD